ncbi:hypothetical protein M440DRAFT_1101495 [Trichoderma longibrachiatum ATCC 18648]|uniref:C3H1-type domain-containing protein n=1 Tax=Trichoderma longibrachiatum ATCC 18648 TaxID=983965 RepID=A0A2T4BRM6_TRILO|nr:hypothetical protein M440DRAFT_1101495 [Trichoderma longibrachiatum ATCC 18648]
MAQSGYGYDYDPSRSYPPQAPYAHQPYHPTYPIAANSYPNGAVRTIVHSEPAPREAHNHHNVIPGLALNFSQNVAQWQDGWTNQQQPAFGPGQPTTTQENVPTQHTDMSEEGEVSEGEVEDVYESRDAEIVGGPSYIHRHTGDYSGFSNTNGRQVAGDPSPVFSAGRERSGSYSPYLSPQEIHHHSSDQIVQPAAQMNGENRSGSSSPHVKTVAAARKQARDAILRLWPLNVRYQDYVNEGIDKSILDGLFEELGFDVDAAGNAAAVTPGPGNAATSGLQNGSTHTGNSQQRHEAEVIPSSAPAKETLAKEKVAKEELATDKAATGESAKDKSEERKDRIARLLAAKGSKPSTSSHAAPPDPAKASASIPASAPPPAAKQQRSAKSQSEKSKILYQKMEALRKARELEARGQKRPHSDGPPQTHQVKDKADNVTATGPSETTTSGIRTASRERTPAQSASPNGQPPSIPGLFLSSTPQPPHSTQPLSLERSASTGLVDSNPRPLKRPFSQTRKSIPFLIDVSDDEDDAAMDIDSPEQKATVLATRTHPALKTTMSLRPNPSFADSAAAAQQYSSPITTPPGMGSDNHAAKDNLDNMTKKIEAMKRRIAEAEARKKAKQSQPDSPALPAMTVDSTNGTSETTNDSKCTSLPISLSIEGQGLPRSTPPMSDPSPELPQLSEASPQSGNERHRSRSRAASERIPIIEARRREQQLKLQLLQAQIASIQREIQQSYEEEEKLKEDVDAVSSSEETQEPQDKLGSPVAKGVDFRQGLSPAKASSPASPTMDAMDIATISSQQHHASRQDREASSPQLEEAQYEQQRGSLIAEQTEQESSANEKMTTQTTNTTAPLVEDAGQEPDQTVVSMQADEATTTLVEETVEGTQTSAMLDAGNANDAEDGSDDYEPPDAELSSPSAGSLRASTSFSPAPADPASFSEVGTSGVQNQEDVSEATAAQQISAAREDTASESGREVDVSLRTEGRPLCLIAQQVDQVSEALAVPAPAPAPVPASDAPRTTFVPYESPLRYFHAYRFHPEYSKTVSGGLRSLTYSNKIDVKHQLCPDELLNKKCSKGKDCVFQHFEDMKAPDDQILLQLGAHGEFDESKRNEYVNGLKLLLTDFRNRKVKDFQTISQGIIDYRAQFLGDKSKILPLGNVTI